MRSSDFCDRGFTVKTSTPSTTPCLAIDLWRDLAAARLDQEVRLVDSAGVWRASPAPGRPSRRPHVSL
ncbi:hypothetical protein FRUB_05032 [Fimbriiglobus ruber]|uniref:Uncharacterized protein n=1 Tax=Fimbriiglobus ruber TaxID=1908690 RepID=A0A225DI59_9BACT|nr:hypothetical protein FRUB_05032 [Fimbriiglobus ruber]